MFLLVLFLSGCSETVSYQELENYTTDIRTTIEDIEVLLDGLEQENEEFSNEYEELREELEHLTELVNGIDYDLR
jgi:predicted  nucleic acid-binding Zn-ribbon protein